MACAQQAGARVDVQSLDGLTPLHLAAMGRWTPIVARLLEAGANATLVDCEGCAPLHRAVRLADADLFNTLFPAAPACLDITDAKGVLPAGRLACGSTFGMDSASAPLRSPCAQPCMQAAAAATSSTPKYTGCSQQSHGSDWPEDRSHPTTACHHWHVCIPMQAAQPYRANFTQPCTECPKRLCAPQKHDQLSHTMTASQQAREGPLRARILNPLACMTQAGRCCTTLWRGAAPTSWPPFSRRQPP